jgi:hypothetical protein
MRASMRPRLDSTRIIMLAGLANDEANLGDAEQHGICDWLSKSDSRMRILEVVGQAIGVGATAGGNASGGATSGRATS